MSMGWIFGKKKKKEEEGKKQSSAVPAYLKDFKPLQRTMNKVDDRKGKPTSDSIEMSEEEIANTRFYGATSAREKQMDLLGKNVKSNNGTVDVSSLTVDNLNKRIEITTSLFKQPALGLIRENIKKAICDTAMTKGEEEREWGMWLAEPSRFFALLMPEMNSEICRREMKMDKDAKESTSDEKQIEANEEENEEENEEKNVQRIDNDNNRVYVGDKKRMDNMSNWINSGQTRKMWNPNLKRIVDYEIYWGQESYRMDSIRKGSENDKANKEMYETWTPEMKKFHEEFLKANEGAKVDSAWKGFEEATRKKYRSSNSKKKNKKDEKALEEEANDCSHKIFMKTWAWVQGPIQNRFFRLTSLMGLDFFKKRGNTIQFARDIGQKDYAGGNANRVITDSEWAHAQRMGYTGVRGHVHRVNSKDQFALRQ